MSHRWPYMAVVLLLLLFAPGCKKREAQRPIVVHVFRDLNSPYAHELDHRILDYQGSNPRLSSGAPIVLETVNEQDFKNVLKNNFEKTFKVEVVILNSATDVEDVPGMQANLGQSVNVCAAVKACPADVPAFVMPGASGDSAEAAREFLDFLAKQK